MTTSGNRFLRSSAGRRRFSTFGKQTAVSKMIFQFGKTIVDIDRERTRAFYETAGTVGESCSCAGCRNLEAAAGLLPPPVGAFLADVGVDLRKVCECYVICANPDGTLLYGGFCHVCGVVPAGGRIDEAEEYPVDERFRVSLREELDLLEEGFPVPALQLEFTASIPWALGGENPYSAAPEAEHTP